MSVTDFAPAPDPTTLPSLAEPSRTHSALWAASVACAAIPLGVTAVTLLRRVDLLQAVAFLQAAGLLLRPQDHVRHHGCPYDGAYCITTGWCNRPLDAIGFFLRLEYTITRVAGAMPRYDEQHALTHGETARHSGARDG